MSTEYEAAAREAADKPVTFKLCGERFSTKAEVDGFVVMELAKAGIDEIEDDDGEESGMRTLATFYEFFDGVMTASEFRRFRKVARRNSVQLDTIITIAKDIIPLLLGRPTTPSSSSAASPIGSGRSSTDGSLAPVASAG